MLIYRGFVVQDEKRMYHPGPALGAEPAQRGWTKEFTDLCRPHLEALSNACLETVSLVIRVGTEIRFLYSVESIARLRVGDRQGQVLPAELTAGGRALLSELSEETLARLYLAPPADRGEPDACARRLGPDQFQSLRAELAGVRNAGFAVNREQTEEGVAAFGAAIRDLTGQPIGAITVAVPTTRFRRHIRGPLIAQLRRSIRDIEADISNHQQRI